MPSASQAQAFLVFETKVIRRISRQSGAQTMDDTGEGIPVFQLVSSKSLGNAYMSVNADIGLSWGILSIEEKTVRGVGRTYMVAMKRRQI